MSTSPPHEHAPSPSDLGAGFQRRLGLFDSTMLVAGTMIGSGIFITSAEIARDVGSAGWLMVVWLLTGVMTIIGALSYAELAGMMPNAGGQYVYLREAYSPLWGFLYGWTCFLVIQTGSIAAVGVAFAKFLGVLVPFLGTDNNIFAVENLGLELFLELPWLDQPLSIFKRERFTVSMGQLVAVLVVLLLTLLNCRGVREGKWVQNIFTVAKTLALIVLIVLGVTVAANADTISRNLGNMWSGIHDTERFQSVSALADLGVPAVILMVLGGAMVGSLFSADAWNNITFTAGEVKNPRRNLPWSLALGTGMVIVLYVLANVAYLAALPVRGDKALAEKLKARANYLKAAESLQSAEIETMKARAAVLEAEGTLLAKDDSREEKRKRNIEEAKRLREQAQQQEQTVQLKTADARARLDADYREATPALGIDHARDDRVGTAALQLASPDLGVTFMAVAIMVSTFGCINGMILMGARLYYAMARDRLFFHAAGRLNGRGVPAWGLMLQGMWSILLIFSGTYNELLDYVIFAALLFYALTVTGLFVLRRARPAADRPYRAFGYPLVPGLYIVLCTAVMVNLLLVKPEFTWPGLIIVLTGIPVYFLWRLAGGRRAAQTQ